MRRSPALAGLSVCTLLVARALAAEEAATSSEDSQKQVCLSAHLQAQQLRRQGKLLKARSELIVCAARHCPEIVQSDCVEWAAQINRSLASVALEAEAEAGDVLDVAVSMDGQPLVEKLDARAIEIDPGVHVFVFRYKDKPPIERQVVVREGERNKPIKVSWAPAKPVAARTVEAHVPSRTYRPIPPSAYIASGIAGLGFAAFAGFGLWGIKQRDDLLESCSPFCSKEDKSSVRSKLIAADIGLGIGIAGLTTGAIFYFTRPQVPLREKAPGSFSLPVDVNLYATRKGADVSIGGAF